MPIDTATATATLLLLFAFFLCSSAAHLHPRHLLHQPFFPVTTAAPPSQPPSPSPSEYPHSHHQQEKHPFSSGTTPYAPPQHNPFFPSSVPASASPPPPSPASLATYPANISSLVFPNHNSALKSRHVRPVTKLVALIIFVISAAFVLSLLAFLLLFFRHRHRHRHRFSPADDAKSSRSDSLRLFNTAPSDASLQQKQPPKYTSTNTSSEFLYLGTLVNSRSGGLDQQKTAVSGNAAGVMGIPFPASSSSSSQYQKLDSPELRPLPPLPKYNAFTPTYRSSEQLNPKGGDDGDENDDENENDEFFSPRGSSGRKQSPTHVWSSSRREYQGIGADHFGSTSFNSRTASYPYSNSCSPTDSMSSTSASPATNTSPTSLKPKSPDSIMNFPAHAQSLNPSLPSFTSSALGYGGAPLSLHRQSSQDDGVLNQSGSVNLPPPPPPPPPPLRFWEIPVCSRITPARDMNAGPMVSVSSDAADSGNVKEEPKEKKNEDSEKEEETLKPKLKPLHWDKVRASSSRVMVWDQIKSSSFQ